MTEGELKRLAIAYAEAVVQDNDWDSVKEFVREEAGSDVSGDDLRAVARLLGNADVAISWD